MILDPRSFPNGWVEPKVLVSEGWRCWVNKMAPLCKLNQIDPRQFASFSLCPFFPGISDRAMSISPCFEDEHIDPQTPGMWIPNMFCRFPIIPLYLIFLFFSGKLRSSDFEITWFWRRKYWSTKTRDASSKHVLHLCANTSSRLGSFFCTPNQWPVFLVCWNQSIPQEGSYNQTFRVLIWQPLRVLKS